MNRFPTLRPLVRALLALCCTPALAATLPAGLQVQQGQAQLQQQGNQLTVRNSPNAILNWQSFSIGAGAGVYFEQANAASKVLNRVVGNDPSQILGSLGSNGQVWLLNPQGVLFGAGARVDVASLVTSTLNLGDADFIAGRYRFSADQGASVRNEGQLRGSLGGQIVLLGGRVENAGTVQAGQVQLAAARQVELVDSGAPNLAVRVEVPTGEVLNLGALSAPGGRIDVHAASVNQQGLVQADSVGTDAQGRIVLQASQRLTLAAGSQTAAAGGEIRLLGEEVGLLNGARVDASAPAGGGRIVVGGGAGGRDASLPNARAVYMGPGAELRADATAAGDGGSIWLWSDQATRAYGRISAQGGPQGGDGGFVETSGGWLDARPSFLSLQAPQGRNGLWLLDPNDIRLVNSGPDSNISGGPNFSSTGDSSVLSVATLAAALNAGNSVTVATATAGANTQAGNILADSVVLTVSPPSPVSLTLDAQGDILLSNTNISSSGSALSVNLAAGERIEIQGGAISTRGGDLVLGRQREVCTVSLGCKTLTTALGKSGDASGLLISGATIDAGAGQIRGGGSAVDAGLGGAWFSDSTLRAQSISLSGLSTGGHGLHIRGSNLSATQLDLKGWVDQPLQHVGAAGVLVEQASVLDIAAGGSATLSGDTVGLRNSRVQGAPASFSLRSDRSIMVRNTPVDFSQGPGTTVLFLSDADADSAGRVRIDTSLIHTGGGNFSITGGTGYAMALESIDANGQPIPGLNQVVFEGSSGVLLSGATIQAGAGTVTVQGKGPLSGPRPDSVGAWGINAIAVNSITAGRIVLQGHGGGHGWGLLSSADPNVGAGAAGAQLNLRATDIDVLVNGVGLEPNRYTGGLQANGQMPKPGLELALTNSSWQASNNLKISAPQGGILLHGVQLSAASMEMNASGTLSLDQATLTANQGVISLRAGTTQGGELKMIDSSVSAASQISLYGEAAVIHNELSGVRLYEGTLLQAPLVQITGIAMGNAAGVDLRGLGGRILAGSTIRIDGRHKLASDDDDGFSLSGNWLLQAGDTVSIRSERNMAFPDDRSQDPRVVAGKLVDIQLLDVLPANASEVNDLSSFAGVLSGLPAGALTRLTLTGIPVTLDTGVSLPSRFELRVDELSLKAGFSLRSTAPGDAITLLGADGNSPMLRFTNEAGANALQTPNGRWLVFMDQGSTSSLGALSPSFTQYSVSPAAFSRDASGNLVIGGTAGSGAFYRSAPPSTSASVAPAAVDSQVALGTALTQSAPTVQLSSPSEGRTLDALPGVGQGSGGTSFTPINSSQMSRAELITLLAARDNYKKKVFADTLHQLQLDPALADVRPCVNEAELASGQCLITEALKAQIQAARLAAAQSASPAPKASSLTGLERLRRAQARKVREAALPTIARKVALLIGVNEYQDDRVPDLSGALTDVRAVQQLLENQLGYDTLVLENASKEAMVRALNQLALETDGNDSVLIYYAGHGVVEPEKQMGYWLPADSRADQAQSWLSNADIARLIALIGARQTLLVSDSCYSGTLAGSEKVQVDRSAAPDSLLSRKAVVVLASGGNEPVADTGRDGHSVFAWHLMQRLQQLSNWQIGNQLYERIRFEVAREFPQTPRYGAARAAGHQDNTDYLFEKRSLEK